MENSINTVLGIENQHEETAPSIKSATRLRIVGTTVLIIGILMGVILLVTTMMVDSGKYTYIRDVHFNPMCIVYAVVSIIPSLIIWAFAQAIADIVDNTAMNGKKH